MFAFWMTAVQLAICFWMIGLGLKRTIACLPLATSTSAVGTQGYDML